MYDSQIVKQVFKYANPRGNRIRVEQDRELQLATEKLQQIPYQLHKEDEDCYKHSQLTTQLLKAHICSL